MDKPDTMATREWIVKKISQEQQIPLATVKIVIDEQFRSAHAALLDNNSLEIAGFGKYVLNRRRVNLRIISYEKALIKISEELKDVSLSDADRKRRSLRYESLGKSLIYLKHKRNGYKD